MLETAKANSSSHLVSSLLALLSILPFLRVRRFNFEFVIQFCLLPLLRVVGVCEIEESGAATPCITSHLLHSRERESLLFLPFIP